jgi:hypothetical protein
MALDTSSAIIGSAVLISGTTLVRNGVEKKTFHFAPVVFGFLLASSLLMLSFFAPNFARGLALMGMIGAFALNGPAVFKLAGGLKGASKK